MKDENRAKLEALLDEEVSGPLSDKIMSLVDDIVRDERIDARKKGRAEGHEAGFATGWDSAHTTYK